MTKTEALALASQLNWNQKFHSANQFADQLDEAGLQIGMDNKTVEWVVLDKDQKELARVA